jgi:hypothetical protein
MLNKRLHSLVRVVLPQAIDPQPLDTTARTAPSPKSPRRLACTTATREDTIRLKQATKSLLKYNESGEIYADLIGRLERMVRAALQGPASDFPTTAPTTNSCAIKLRDHLLITAYGRIVTGEDQIIVEHEAQWANWMVEASRTGVMHLKGPGCRCRSDWDEN